MGYSLEAFIARSGPIENLAGSLQGAVIVSLPQDMKMIPITYPVKSNLEKLYSLPDTDSFEKEIERFEPVGREASKDGSIAYVNIEMFGGTGLRGCILWENGAVSFGPHAFDTGQDYVPPGQEPINEALRKLGVVRGPHSDEFDALGLGAHRSTDKWVEAAKP